MLLRCSAEAYAQCNLKHHCGDIYDAVFSEGSECHRFNQLIEDNAVALSGRETALMDGPRIDKFMVLETMLQFKEKELREVRHDLDSWRSAALFYANQVKSWIHVTERLPYEKDVGRMVLALAEDKRYMVTTCWEVHKFKHYDIYWMPLPALPKEE